MNTMRRVRFFFGFFAAILCVVLCLWFGLQTFVEKQLRAKVSHYGFRIESIKGFSPLFTGLKAHQLKLVSYDETKHIFIDDCRIYLSINSLFYKTLKHVDLSGVQCLSDIQGFKALMSSIFMSNKEESSKTSYLTSLHLSGFCLLSEKEKIQNSQPMQEMKSEQPEALDPILLKNDDRPVDEVTLNKENRDPFESQAHFIPFDLVLMTENFKYFADIDLRYISSFASTNASVHLEKDINESSSNIILNNFNTKISGMHLYAKRFLLSSLSPLTQGQPLELTFRGDDIHLNLFSRNDKKKSPVHFETKLCFSHNDFMFKVDGQGALLCDDQKADIKIATVDDEVTLDMNAKNINAYSFLKLFNYFSGQELSDMRGTADVHLFAKMPLSFSEKEQKDIFTSCLYSVVNSFQQKQNKGFLKVDLKDITASHDIYSVDKLNAQLRFSLFPFYSNGKQLIQAESAHVSKLSFSKPRFTFLMKENVKIEEFTTQFLGGNLRLHSFEKDRNPKSVRDAETTSFTFDVDHMDLLEILTLLNIENLSGTGRMGGHGQLRFSSKNGLDVKNAKFFSSSPSGHIYYPDLPIANVGKALENIAFTMLSVELVPEEGKLQALVEILGHNPHFMNGYPHRFKIKTTGNLQETLESSLSFLNVSDNSGANGEKLNDNLKQEDKKS